MTELARVSLIALEQSNSGDLEMLSGALASTGFFILTDHGSSAAEFAALESAAVAFHELSQPSKQRVALRNDFTGWVPFGTGRIATSDLNPYPVPDLYEAFLIKRWMLDASEAWPAELPSLRSDATAHFRKMERLGARLLPILERVLGLPERYFDGYFLEGEMTLRLNIYPAATDPEPTGAYRMAPHTDSGFLTFLPGGSLDALDLRDEGAWHLVGRHEGDLAVNTGALLERWSNGAVVASPHRVSVRTGSQLRCTTPFFFSPSRDALIQPMPNGRPATSLPIRFGDFLEWFMRSNLPDTPLGL